MKTNQGMILISLIVIIGMILVLTAVFSTHSVFFARASLDKHQSEKALVIAESLLYDSIQQYLRFGHTMPNPYPDWSSSCLQESDWMCRMDLSLEDSGGTIEVWGQYGQKIRHLHSTLTVDGQGRVQVTSIQELY